MFMLTYASFSLYVISLMMFFKAQSRMGKKTWIVTAAAAGLSTVLWAAMGIFLVIKTLLSL